MCCLKSGDCLEAEFPLHEETQGLFSLKTFNWLDVAHPHDGVQSALVKVYWWNPLCLLKHTFVAASKLILGQIIQGPYGHIRDNPHNHFIACLLKLWVIQIVSRNSVAVFLPFFFCMVGTFFIIMYHNFSDVSYFLFCWKSLLMIK